jgi:DNA-binding protein HU-beta
MKKADFIRVVAEKTSMSKKDTEMVLNTALKTVQDILVDGDSITFMGFGTFDVIARSERETILPGSTKKVLVRARTSVKFKVGKNLKEAVLDVVPKITKKTRVKAKAKKIVKKEKEPVVEIPSKIKKSSIKAKKQ